MDPEKERLQQRINELEEMQSRTNKLLGLDQEFSEEDYRYRRRAGLVVAAFFIVIIVGVMFMYPSESTIVKGGILIGAIVLGSVIGRRIGSQSRALYKSNRDDGSGHG